MIVWTAGHDEGARRVPLADYCKDLLFLLEAHKMPTAPIGLLGRALIWLAAKLEARA